MSGTGIALIYVLSLFFVCFAAGSTILGIFKIKKNQISSKTIIGFFTLLAIVAMISFILNIFGSLLPLQVYVYFFWGFILIFAAVSLIFVKYWFKTFKLNWNILILSILFAGYFLYFYFKLDMSTVTLTLLVWFVEQYMETNGSGQGPLRNVFFQLMITPLITNYIVTGIPTSSSMLADYLFMFNVLIRALMYTALTAIILEMGIGHTKISKIVISIIISGSIFGFIALTTNLQRSLDGTMMFVYLIQLISVMFAYYCVNENRYKMYTYLLGIMTLAAIGMDQTKIVILLFFIYAILLILTYSFDNMLFKDHIKILFPVSIGSLLYNLSTMNIVWIIVSGAILVFTILVVIWIFTSHVLIKNMEFTLSNRTSILMVVVPVVLIVFGILSFLAVPDWTGDAVEEKFGYLFKYRWVGLIKDPLMRLPILISITAFELVICFLWVSRRRKFKNKFRVILVDFVVIQYLMFFNPFARMFWILVLENQTQIQYDIFNMSYGYLALAGILWIIQRVEKEIMEILDIKLTRDEDIKIIVYSNIITRSKDKFDDWKNKTKDRRSKKTNKRLKP